MGRVVGVLLAVFVTISSSAWGGGGAPRFTEIGANVRLSGDQFGDPTEPGREFQRQAHVAIDPTDRRHLLVASIEGRRTSDGYPLAVGYYSSHDAGKTWDAGLIPGVSAATDSTMYDFATDPVVAFGPDGTPFYASWSFDPGGDSAIHVSHTDEAGNWELPVVVASDEDGSQVLDQPWVAVDQGAGSPFLGRVYVAWIEYLEGFGFNQMFVSSSDDGGHTWSSPVSITDEQATIGAQILIEEDGVVTVVYFSFTGERISAVRSVDGGATWADEVTVSEVEEAPVEGQRTGVNLPSATIDPQTQTMHVVWQDSRRDDADILHSRSTDAGATWSDPRRINGGPKGLESFDAAVAAAGGAAHVIFYDGRDSKDRDDLYNVYYAQSTNDGASFLDRNLRVTSRSFDIDYAAPSAGGLFLADYIGIAALRKRVHAVWIDTRRPSQVTDSKGQNDLFSAKITP